MRRPFLLPLSLLWFASGFAFLARGFEFVARVPSDRLGLSTSQPAENEAEAGEPGVAPEIPAFLEFVGGLMVVVGDVIFELRFSPSFVVAFEKSSGIDGEGGDADASEREVVGAVIVTGGRLGVWLDL
jgi:hypothetical protein